MIKLIIKRLAIALPTLIIIIAFVFCLMRLAPGGPFTNERALPPEIEQKINEAYDLDKPLIQQFGLYLSKVAKGDLGPSYKYKDFTVNELISSGFPVSLTLGLSAIILSLFLGSFLGIIAAIKRNTIFDYTVMGISLVGICIPSFVLAPILSLFLGLYLGLLPISGWNGGNITNLILPIVSLSLPQIAVISRMMRASTIETLNSNFIRTARAKGLPKKTIISKHVIRSSILPVIDYLAPATAGLMTGSIIIEQIFGLPGIGRYFVVGALQRDYTLVSGVMILYASLLMILILLSDILRAVLDPRVKT
ncbi:MAG: ABC transporter permease subunit [Pseudomonadota bacterium]|nr:ABC transporter permease subunit [Pseudomonadota bacterium]MEC9414395.1 ABC transporter permease subunit [Pseudomonadota bacterium]MEC9458781.1 ABC transporter permease subunit [Pseudomonadota bacterium]